MDVDCPRLKEPSGPGNQTLAHDYAEAHVHGCTNSADPPKKRSGKLPKPVKPAEVTIKLTLRGSKKFVTTVTGLEAFLPPAPPGGGGGLKDAARTMATKLAAGASVVKGGPGEGGDHISIQGDVVQAVSALCAERLGVPPGSIRVAKTESKSWKMT